MLELILAVLFLLLSHFGISSTGLRPWLVERFGAGVYLGGYSLIAVAAFILLVSAYSRADLIPLWPTGAWQIWLTLLIMPISALLFVSALTATNPTVAGQALVSKRIEPPSGVLRITRHPMMWAFGLWGLSHIVANGDLASCLLFGGITALALIGTVLIDARYRERLSNIWPAFAEKTSNLPFLAIIQGRQQLHLGEIGWWRVGLALGLFAILLALHTLLFGVSPLGSL